MPEFDNETYDLPSDEMNNNKLNKLAEAFTKLSKGEKLEEAEDIAFVDVVHEKDDNALHEEREEGL
jgi:hypothetical protein